MCNILISLGKPATPELLDAILVALSSGWGEAKVDVAGNTTVISFGTEPVATDIPPGLPPEPDKMPDVDSSDEMGNAIEIATVTTGLPPEEAEAAMDAVTINALAPETPANPDAVPTIPARSLPNAILKSLSLSTQIHAELGNDMVSVLKMNNVSIGNGLITFTFGGIEYKYPSVDYDSVNLVFAFTGNEAQNFYGKFKVVQTDGQEAVIFGQDLASQLVGV